ncbi:EpsI family protein [Oscillatoria amoena NRMC-F 0135]|nr:EpsI family protein [Oscillatoria amoena NRMC-F 0135]
METFAPIRRRFLTLCIFLAIQSALLLGLSLPEKPFVLPEIEAIPGQLGAWRMTGEEMLDPATQALLRPDLSIMRGYARSADGPLASSQPAHASLFIGYFKSTQANSPGPHSPTVCLPGAGWKEVFARESSLDTAQGSIPINEYVLEKGNQRLAVLYWYQNSQRAWAKQVLAKVYMLPDFLELRRSDVSLVRITALTSQSAQEQSLKQMRDLAQEVYPALHRQLQASRQ